MPLTHGANRVVQPVTDLAYREKQRQRINDICDRKQKLRNNAVIIFKPQDYLSPTHKGKPDALFMASSPSSPATEFSANWMALQREGLDFGDVSPQSPASIHTRGPAIPDGLPFGPFPTDSRSPSRSPLRRVASGSASASASPCRSAASPPRGNGSSSPARGSQQTGASPARGSQQTSASPARGKQQANASPARGSQQTSAAVRRNPQGTAATNRKNEHAGRSQQTQSASPIRGQKQADGPTKASSSSPTRNSRRRSEATSKRPQVEFDPDYDEREQDQQCTCAPDNYRYCERDDYGYSGPNSAMRRNPRCTCDDHHGDGYGRSSIRSRVAPTDSYEHECSRGQNSARGHEAACASTCWYGDCDDCLYESPRCTCPPNDSHHDSAPGYYEPTGHYDRAPRHYDHATGHCDHATGHYDRSPGHYDHEPERYDRAPGHHDRSPGHHDRSPGHHNRSPGQHDRSPGHHDRSPGHHDHSPRTSARNRAHGSSAPDHGYREEAELSPPAGLPRRVSYEPGMGNRGPYWIETTAPRRQMDSNCAPYAHHDSPSPPLHAYSARDNAPTSSRHQPSRSPRRHRDSEGHSASPSPPRSVRAAHIRPHPHDALYEYAESSPRTLGGSPEVGSSTARSLAVPHTHRSQHRRSREENWSPSPDPSVSRQVWAYDRPNVGLIDGVLYTSRAHGRGANSWVTSSQSYGQG